MALKPRGNETGCLRPPAPATNRKAADLPPILFPLGEWGRRAREPQGPRELPAGARRAEVSLGPATRSGTCARLTHRSRRTLPTWGWTLGQFGSH